MGTGRDVGEQQRPQFVVGDRSREGVLVAGLGQQRHERVRDSLPERLEAHFLRLSGNGDRPDHVVSPTLFIESATDQPPFSEPIIKPLTIGHNR
jgi:hypothetical protein